MKELYKSLAAFQQEVPNIYKNAKGYGYKFADLGEINEIIRPILKKHGLGYAQPLDGDKIKTIIFHVESGESIESSANIPQGVQLKGMNDFQVLGSGITYLRRYSLSSMLGLITDEDADAAGEQVKKEVPKPVTKPVTTQKTKYVFNTEQGSMKQLQKEMIFNLLQQRGISKDDMTPWVLGEFGVNLPEASEEDAAAVIDSLDTKEK